jgi:hypothetical protein
MIHNAMRNLTEQDLIRLWESGLDLHPIDRALTMLAAAHPALSWDDLQTLSIGQRDGRLLEVWEHTFGPTLEGYAECPQCGERLEFQIEAAQVHAVGSRGIAASTYDWVNDQFAIEFRLPNSRDLAVAATAGQLETAYWLLVNRCIIGAFQSGEQIMPSDLPVEIVQQIAEGMTRHDPLAEVLLNLTCPACQKQWQAHFDITTFLWSELAVTAKRLLREVHTLARAYGWREADILALSAVRRQYYLEMVS